MGFTIGLFLRVVESQGDSVLCLRRLAKTAQSLSRGAGWVLRHAGLVAGGQGLRFSARAWKRVTGSPGQKGESEPWGLGGVCGAQCAAFPAGVVGVPRP